MVLYQLHQVFDALRLHLRGQRRQLECFCQYEFQAEGWLKAEWVAVLDGLQRRKRIQSFDREVSGGRRRKIDLAIDLDDGRHWIELKHWLTGKQKGQIWSPVDFIWDLESECAKLEAVCAGDRAWVAALCTPNPKAAPWRAAVRQFNRERAPWRLKPVDQPQHYPETYFLGLLHVSGLGE